MRKKKRILKGTNYHSNNSMQRGSVSTCGITTLILIDSKNIFTMQVNLSIETSSLTPIAVLLLSYKG